MLHKEIEKALNEQVALEAIASSNYLSMASWCEKEGLLGAAKFLYRQSEEENQHKLKIFKYINESGGHALTPEIKKVNIHFKSILQVFQSALEHEIANTKSISAMIDLCLKLKDYGTFNFLQWFIAEQHEEEMLFHTILDKIRIISNDEKGLYWIDREIGSIEVK